MFAFRNENYNQVTEPKPSTSGIKLLPHKVKTKLKKEGDFVQKRGKAAPIDEADSVASHIAVKDSSSSSGDSPLSGCSDAENDGTVIFKLVFRNYNFLARISGSCELCKLT